jgi:hypothetical protein
MPTKGANVEEMTHAEHVAYLEDEAEKQAAHNAEVYEKQEAAYKKASERTTPATASPDELRSENLKAVEAELAQQAPADAKKKPVQPPPSHPSGGSSKA